METVNVKVDWRGSALEAVLPTIPPRLRPGSALRNYFILWEAEWTRRAPVDPMLLRRITRDCFAVVAHWYLTDVERAVLESRL